MSLARRFVLLCAVGQLTIAPALAAQPAVSVGFDSLWRWEQGQRATARAAMSATASTDEQRRAAAATLESTLRFVRQPTLRAVTSSNGQPLLVFQQADILSDLARLYAQLKQPNDVARALRELVTYLDGRDSPITMGLNSQSLYTYYADAFASGGDTAGLRDDPTIRALLTAMWRKDTERAKAGYPFSVEYADTVSLADRVAGLSYLWSEAKYNFANFSNVAGLDWTAQYRQALPRVIQAKSTLDYYRELQRFIAALADGHTDVQVPRVLAIKYEMRPRLVPELIDGRVFIRRVGNPAFARVGFSAGQEILRIDDVPVIEYGRTRIEPYIAASTPQHRDVQTFSKYLLRGPHGTPARLTIRERDGATRTIDAPRDSTLPWDIQPPYSMKWLPGKIALVTINTMADPVVVERFRADLPSFRSAAGLIFDIRANEGGNSDIGYEILQYIVATPTPTSTWSTPNYRPAFRSWDRPQPAYEQKGGVITPSPTRYRGPVAVLIGSMTFSAAEDFAVAFDVSKRGPLVGEATGGSTGNPISLRLPSGGFARVCSKRDRYPDGRDFVGVGVQPTRVVARRAEDMLTGGDSVLDAALQAITTTPVSRRP